MQHIAKFMLIVALIFGAVGLSDVQPAEARSRGLQAIVIEPGKIALTKSGQYYTCRQYIASPQGVTLAGWRIEPRIQWKEVQRLPRRWQNRPWPLKDRWVYPTRTVWHTAGGVASRHEIKSHRNARISRLINNDTNRPTNPWNFSRKRRAGEEVRCIAIYALTANKITGYHPVSKRPIWGDHRTGVLIGRSAKY